MLSFAYTASIMVLGVILVIFAFLDRIYRELGRVTTGRLHRHLDIFEAEVEPHFQTERRQAALGFSILANLLLAAVVVETARGVYASAPTYGEAVSQLIVYVLVEILLFVQFIPDVLLARTESRWLEPLAPVLRGALLATWPLRALLNLAISVAHISDEEAPAARESQQQGLEALMDAAQEEGILASNEAQLDRASRGVQRQARARTHDAAPGYHRDFRERDDRADAAVADRDQIFTRAGVSGNSRRRAGYRAGPRSAANSRERSENPNRARTHAPGAVRARNQAGLRTAPRDAAEQPAGGDCRGRARAGRRGW